MMYELSTSLEACGVSYEIRSDYRAVLDICTALADPELTDEDKAIAALYIFYSSFEEMPSEHYREATKKCFWFIDCGSEEKADKKSPRLVDFKITCTEAEKTILGQWLKAGGRINA